MGFGVVKVIQVNASGKNKSFWQLFACLLLIVEEEAIYKCFHSKLKVVIVVCIITFKVVLALSLFRRLFFLSRYFKTKSGCSTWNSRFFIVYSLA
jgi:hypothetical protein